MHKLLLYITLFIYIFTFQIWFEGLFGFWFLNTNIATQQLGNGDGYANKNNNDNKDEKDEMFDSCDILCASIQKNSINEIKNKDISNLINTNYSKHIFLWFFHKNDWIFIGYILSIERQKKTYNQLFWFVKNIS